MKIRNPSNAVVNVNPELYDYLIQKDGYTAVRVTSEDYTVREAKELMEDMSDKERKEFLKGETRKSLI